MKSYIAFIKKEILESIYTYKLFILLAVFIFLGILSPLTAKFTPLLMESLMSDGIKISLPDPSNIDSWIQFYKNISQMGFIALIVIFSGIFSTEYEKSTLINMITKGLPRKAVVLAKYTMMVLSFSVSYILSFVISYAYTIYFWDNSGLNNIFFAALCPLIFALFILSTLVLGGVFFNYNYGNLLFSGAFIALLNMLKIFPKFDKYNIIGLISNNVPLLQGSLDRNDFTYSIIIWLILTVVSIISSILIFNKKQL